MKQLILALAAAIAFCASALAADYTLGSLTIDHPFARATAGPARAGAAYLAIENAGDAADRLVGAKADVAGQTMLHETIKDGDVMRMRPVAGGLAVPAHGKVELKPGGLHVMLMGLTGPLKEGTTFPLTLTFEKAGDITVDVAVEGVAAGAN